MPAGSINQVADWQDEIQFAKETTYGTPVVSPNLNVWGCIGSPEIEPGPEWIDSGEGGSGTSERQIGEFAVGKTAATVGWTSRATDVRVSHLLRSMTQSNGTTVAGPPVATTWDSGSAVKYPWIAQPAANIGYTIIASQLDLLANASPQFAGAIAQSFSLESEEGNFVKLTMKWQGTTATMGAAPAATSLMPGIGWQHYNLHMSVDAVAQTPSKHKIEFTNNLIPFYGTSNVPIEFALGQLGIKGSFSLPLKLGITEYAKFLAKTPVVIVAAYYTTGATAAGCFTTTFDATYSSAKFVDYNGLKMVDFEYTQAKNATTTSAKTYTSAVW